MECVLPSGMSGSFRGMTVKEERILSDRKAVRSGRFIDQLLSACWAETTDVGPYDFDGNVVDWKQVLQGDRMAALIAVRCATYGTQFEFAYGCASCRRRNRKSIDLMGDVERKPLSDESRAIFRDGNIFQAYADGTLVKFRLLVGADDERLAKLADQAGMTSPISASIRTRIIDVAGVERRGIQEWIEGLPLGVAMKLQRDFEAADCGVQTKIEVECPACYETQDVELPFDKGFWLPG